MIAKGAAWCVSRRWVAALSQPRPVRLVLRKDERALVVSFDDGTTAHLSAEYLRTQSPSAKSQVVGGRRGVRIMAVRPVGNYAVQLVFDDLHDSGIFSFALLHQLHHEKIPRMRAFLKALRSSGQTRERRARTG